MFNPLITFLVNTTATAEDQNSQDVDIAAGLTNALTRDGQAPMNANLPMGGHKVTNVAAATAAGDAVIFSQLTALVPIGAVVDFAGGSTPPANWLLCNGAEVSRAGLPALFAVISTAFGAGNGSTTFNLPDCRGRVIAGVDGTGTRLTSATMAPDGFTNGAVGGIQQDTLIGANLPPYTPAGSVSTSLTSLPPSAGELVEGGTFLIGDVNPGAHNFLLVTGLDTFGTPAASSSFTGSAQGGTSTPFSNVQPTILMNKIIRYQ